MKLGLPSPKGLDLISVLLRTNKIMNLVSRLSRSTFRLRAAFVKCVPPPFPNNLLWLNLCALKSHLGHIMEIWSSSKFFYQQRTKWGMRHFVEFNMFLQHLKWGIAALIFAHII